MKYLLSILVSLLVATGTFAQGILEIKKPEIHLKNLKADDQPHTEIIQVKNTGNTPVIINRVTPMNSQMNANWSREPIVPGKNGEIRITFVPMNIQENFDLKIYVYSNARNNRTEFSISGNIIDNPAKPELLYKNNMDGLKFKTTNLNFSKIYNWQKLSDTLDFINTRKEAVTMSVHYQPSHLTTTFVPEKVEPGKKGMAIVTYDAPQKNDYGYSYETLILSINNSKTYNNRITVTANILEDFSKLTKKELANAPATSFEKKEINFGDIKPGEKANCDFVLTNIGKSPLLIRKTKASCGCTAVTLGEDKVLPGKSTTIRATFDSAGKSGRQYKSITIITNDPQTPETVLTITGDIKS